MDNGYITACRAKNFWNKLCLFCDFYVLIQVLIHTLNERVHVVWENIRLE